MGRDNTMGRLQRQLEDEAAKVCLLQESCTKEHFDAVLSAIDQAHELARKHSRNPLGILRMMIWAVRETQKIPIAETSTEQNDG